MNKIATTYNSNANASYDLVMMSYGELKELVIKDSGMSEKELFSFDMNNETDVLPVGEVDKLRNEVDDLLEKKNKNLLSKRYDKLSKIREESSAQHFKDLVTKELGTMTKEEYIDHVLSVGTTKSLTGIEKWVHPKLTEKEKIWYHDVKQKEKEYVTNQKIINEKSNSRINKVTRAIETYFFVIEERHNGKYVLLDGFNRLFGSYYENLDKQVFVKVYKKLDDQQYTQIVLEANDWKIKSNGYDENFLDRGVKLSLYIRYEIDLRKAFGYNGYKSMKRLGYLLDETVSLKDLLNYIIIVNGKANKPMQPYMYVFTYVYGRNVLLFFNLFEEETFFTLNKEALNNSLNEFDFTTICEKLEKYESETYAEKYIQKLLKNN